MIGKRKRAPAREANAPDQDASDAQEIFRKHFESQFAPLPSNDAPNAIAHSNDDASEIENLRSDDDLSSSPGDVPESDWSGISDSSTPVSGSDEPDQPTSIIIDHSTSIPTTTTMSRKQQRAYLSSRPPNSSALDIAPRANVVALAAAIPAEASSGMEDSKALLANDLALQRLISESHILSADRYRTSMASGSSPSAAGADLFADGRTRQRTTSLRLAHLTGGNEGKQQKMSMSMRKGILSAAHTKDAKRRREARENGIILECGGAPSSKDRRKGGAGAGDSERDRERRKKPGTRLRNVDAPGMGKMKGGELRLTKRAVEDIRSGGGKKRSNFGGIGKRKGAW